MRFILDAHLPESIREFFPEHDVVHTSSLDDGNKTADGYINDYTIREQRILITKDTDFYYSFIASRKPYKLVLVKLGNMRLGALREYFRRNSNIIVEQLTDHSFLILEPTRIRILV